MMKAEHIVEKLLEAEEPQPHRRLQQRMDAAYANLPDFGPSGTSGSDDDDWGDLYASLPEDQRLATVIGNFNYQVENGGLAQYIDNGYSGGLKYIKEYGEVYGGALAELWKHLSEEIMRFVDVDEDGTGLDHAIRQLDQASDEFSPSDYSGSIDQILAQFASEHLNDEDIYVDVHMAIDSALSNVDVDELPDDLRERIENLDLAADDYEDVIATIEEAGGDVEAIDSAMYDAVMEAARVDFSRFDSWYYTKNKAILSQVEEILATEFSTPVERVRDWFKKLASGVTNIFKRNN